MTIRLQKELAKMKKMILSLGTMVETRLRESAGAIEEGDTVTAKRIADTDYEIDEMEVEIEEECLKIMALYQPVASDLRFLVVVIKINNDLERIADLAVNIARRVFTIAKRDGTSFDFDYTRMSDIVQKMLKNSLDAFVNLDAGLAKEVLHMDDEVDKLNRHVYDLVREEMKQNPENVSYLINCLLIARHLERIADHVTNIAEEVIFMIEGEIVRHLDLDTP